MMDILHIPINLDEFERLRVCQLSLREDCHAAFTVSSSGQIWALASWDETALAERVDVRGWIPVLDKIADEFLLWWNQGGVFFVGRESVTRRMNGQESSGVLFLYLEVNRRMRTVPWHGVERRRQTRAYSLAR